MKLINFFYNVLLFFLLLILGGLGLGNVWIGLPIITIHIAILLQLQFGKTRSISNAYIAAVTSLANYPKKIAGDILNVERRGVKSALLLLAIYVVIFSFNFLLNVDKMSTCLSNQGASQLNSCYKNQIWYLNRNAED